MNASYWQIWGDGITDCTDALQRAVNGDSSLTFDPGGYVVSGPIIIPPRVGFYLHGAGRYTTQFLIKDPSADIFTFQGTKLFDLRDFSIGENGSVQRTGGAYFKLVGANQGTFERIRMLSPWRGFDVQDSTQINWDAIWAIASSNSWPWSSGWYFANSSALNISHVIAGSGQAPLLDAMFSIDYGIDTLFMSDVQAGPNPNDLAHGGVGIRCWHSGDPAASFDPRWIRLSNVSLEGGNAPAFQVDAVNSLSLMACQGASSRNGLLVNGGQDIQVHGGLYGHNSEHGIRINGGRHVRLHGPTISGNSLAKSGTYDGVSIGPVADEVMVAMADISSAVFSESQHRYGVAIDVGTVKAPTLLYNRIADYVSGDIFDGSRGTAKILRA